MSTLATQPGRDPMRRSALEGSALPRRIRMSHGPRLLGSPLLGSPLLGAPVLGARWLGAPVLGARWLEGLCSLGLALVLLGTATTARAQEIDLTYTQPPVVMLAIDTSGSMQWSGERIQRDDRASPAITCALSNTEKSREAVVKEVLTGTFSGYKLTATTANTNSGTNKVDCNVGAYKVTSTSQAADGLLDLYRERLRFAYSTYDNNTAMTNSSSSGDWSYPGTTSPAPQDGHLTKSCTSACSSCGCPGGATATGCVNYPAGGAYGFTRSFCYGNVGIKSLTGAPCSGNGCLLSCGPVGSDITAQNDAIQTQILANVSSGNTPIAGMLKDIRWWFDNHPDVKIDSASSNYMRCRKNFVLLVTDGLPNSGCGYSNASATRPEICFLNGSCTRDTDCPSNTISGAREWHCIANTCESILLSEVDQGAAQRAADLYNPSGGRLSVPVHVVGFDFPAAITCTSASDCLNGQTCTTVPGQEIKRCSCADDTQCYPGESCEVDATGLQVCRIGGAVRDIAAAGGGQALFANDPTSLRTAINQIFSQIIPESTSRTRVTSTSAVAPLTELPSNFPQTNASALYLFQSAFTVPATSVHWKGYLQRVSIGNIGTANSPIIGPITQATGLHGTVRFDDLLNVQPRPTDDQGTAYDRKIYTYKGGAIVAFTTTNITPTDLGVATTALRDTIVNFVRGEVGSARFNNRLGAIYHASPVILEPPILDLALPSYQTFKQDTTIRQRPPIVFVGSNLGLLHAFNAKTAKEEWAFIPPALLLTLKNQTSGFTYGVDATPVARDIQMTTLNASSDSKANWRSVVVAPMGQGASAVVALDVTTPVYSASNDPPFKFLWQFDQTSSVPTNKLGVPFGSPTVGTVFLNDNANLYPFQERAVVLLPGGKTPSGGTAGQGEDVWVLDLATGKVLRRFPGYSGSGGMTGTCAALDDFPGTFITRVFCGDASGRLMRINMADSTLAAWSSEASWYDLFGSLAGTRAAIYSAPALANRKNGDLVVLFGNGDPNDLENNTETRLAFVEELPTVDSTSGLTTGFTAKELKLQVLTNGEKLTGSPVIYNSVAYWATFVPDTSTQCSFGRTRLWGVQFDQFTPVGSTANPLTDAFIPKLDSLCGPDATIDTSDDVQGITAACLLPTGTVSFGFDVVRSPAVTVTPTGGSGSTGGMSASSTTTGGSLKLVFQTGTGQISSTSKLRDPELTPPGNQKIQVGAINVPSAQGTVRTISWGKVTQ